MGEPLTDFMQNVERPEVFAATWQKRLLADGHGAGEMSESRAKAVLRAVQAVDTPTLNDFSRLMRLPTAQRVALHDLLMQVRTEARDELEQINHVQGEKAGLSWIVLALAVHARVRSYPLGQLDPSNPPDEHSPAGQAVRRTGQFIRAQVQRGVTERDRLARRIAFAGISSADSSTLQNSETPMVPSPAVFRPPVPEQYPELNPAVTLTPDEIGQGPHTLVITEDDLPGDRSRTSVSEPPIRVEDPPPATSSQPPAPLPPSAVLMPSDQNSARPPLTVQVRETALRARQVLSKPPLKSTKLRILVQEYPDGTGYLGVQVKVTCKRIRAHVAGTTNRQGIFLCELPVKETEGLTYDVDVTWPLDAGGSVERKSITLNADRTEFVLPFYRRQHG